MIINTLSLSGMIGEILKPYPIHPFDNCLLRNCNDISEACAVSKRHASISDGTNSKLLVTVLHWSPRYVYKMDYL